MEDAIAKAPAECFSLSTLMYKKLPKELRDMVYSYLCLEDRQVPIGPYYHFRKYEPQQGTDKVKHTNTEFHPRSGDLQTDLSDGKIRTDHDIYPEDDLILPNNHIFDASYMSREVVLELLKMYYQSNSFSVCNIEGGLDGLCSSIVCNSDGSILDFVPLDYIRELQIRIKCEHFDAVVRSPAIDTRPRLKDLAAKMSFLQHTVESLQVFREKIQTTSHELNVEIVLMSNISNNSYFGASRPVHVINLLQTVRNMVYELKHNREHTTVRVTSQDDDLWAFPRNYTGLFNMTKEKWDYVSAVRKTWPRKRIYD